MLSQSAKEDFVSIISLIFFASDLHLSFITMSSTFLFVPYRSNSAYLEKEEEIDRSSNAVSIWNFRFQIEFFGFKVAVRRNNPGLERATSKKSLSGIHLVMRSECASRWSFLFGFNPSRGADEPLSFEHLNLLHFFAPGSGAFERRNYKQKKRRIVCAKPIES